jgi:hypothetical protein
MRKQFFFHRRFVVVLSLGLLTVVTIGCGPTADPFAKPAKAEPGVDPEFACASFASTDSSIAPLPLAGGSSHGEGEGEGLHNDRALKTLSRA